MKPVDGFRPEGLIGVRRYNSYEEYLQHQGSKLAESGDRLREISQKKNRDQRFCDRFDQMKRNVDIQGSVLCLGARLGDEVRGFRLAGFPAVGVDVNPGRNNADVIAADFHYLPFAADSFDGAYSNVMDHVLDVHRFMHETIRVVKANGWVYLELTGGVDQIGRADPWGAMVWETNEDLVAVLRPYIKQMRYDREEANRRVLVFTPNKEKV